MAKSGAERQKLYRERSKAAYDAVRSGDAKSLLHSYIRQKHELERALQRVAELESKIDAIKRVAFTALCVDTGS